MLRYAFLATLIDILVKAFGGEGLIDFDNIQNIITNMLTYLIK